MEQAVVSAVVQELGEAKITVTGVPDQVGVAAALFTALAERDVNVDMIVQNTSLEGHTDISFTVPIRRSRGRRRGLPDRAAGHRRPRGHSPTPASPRCRSSARG